MSDVREFWIKARGLQDGKEINISLLGENRWIDTTVQQIYPNPENSVALKMGPWIHVVEKKQLDEAKAECEKLKAENEKFRAALEDISQNNRYCDTDHSEIAREALK
jgi:antitoxin component of MazEF toxin-antitoxin module